MKDHKNGDARTWKTKGLPGKVLVVDVLGQRDLGDVDLGRGGHQVPLVHPPE